MEYDGLWNEPPSGARSWYSQLTDDERAWLDGLAQHIVDRGNEPFWRPVAERFKEKFPSAKPAGADTIKTTVRKLVAGQ